MSHKKIRPFIIKVSVLGYFPLLLLYDYIVMRFHIYGEKSYIYIYIYIYIYMCVCMFNSCLSSYLIIIH